MLHYLPMIVQMHTVIYFQTEKIIIVIFFLSGDPTFPMLKDISRSIWYIYSGSPARYSRRITSERNERICFSPPPLPSFLPASLPLSVSRVSLQARAVSEFWRSTEGWEPFMVRIPNPDTTLRLPHTCTTSRARVGEPVRVRVHECPCETCIRARTRVLLDVRISICLKCIVSYVLNEHSAALMYSRTRAHVCSRGCVAKTARRYILRTSE